jgi:hypothetical protein
MESTILNRLAMLTTQQSFDAEDAPKPDTGEQTYRGSGRHIGRKAIVTEADSGIFPCDTLEVELPP